MPKIFTPYGDIKIRVYHGSDNVWIQDQVGVKGLSKLVPRRYTQISLDGPKEVIPTPTDAISICHTNDQFCRLTGRKIAANRLLEKLRSAGVSYHVRQQIFDTICPEFTRKKGEARR